MSTTATPAARPWPALVVFDCDGVLVDSEGPANRVFAERLNNAGLAVTADEVHRRFTGLSLDDCYRVLAAEYNFVAPAGFDDDLETHTQAAFARELQAIPGADTVLQRLLAEQIPMCVASSGRPTKIRSSLTSTGLIQYFQDQRIFSAEQVAAGKPAPDLFLFAAAACQTNPMHAVVIEDSLPGVQAGRSAGMAVLGLVGTCSADELAAAGATVVNTMAEAVALLLPSLASG